MAKRCCGVGFITGNTVYGLETKGTDAGNITYGISKETGYPYIGVRTCPSGTEIGNTSIVGTGELRFELITYPNIRRALSNALSRQPANIPLLPWLPPPYVFPIP